MRLALREAGRGLAAATLLLAGCHAGLQPEAITARLAASANLFPGPQADGSVVLPNQWRLDPVGRQIAVGDFPVNIALHPDGRYAVVLHSGYGPHELAALDLRGMKLISRVGIEEGFYGLSFSPDGAHIYASGAGGEVIHTFDFRDGYLSGRRAIALRDVRERGIPAGLAVSRDGRRLWAANLLGQSISLVDLEHSSLVTNSALIALPQSASPSAASTPRDLDQAALTKRAEALLDALDDRAPYPYACVADENRGRLYVSLWAQAAVQVLDLATLTPVARWTTQEHPNEMVLSHAGRFLFVANANRNSVSVLDTESGQTLETLLAELTPDSLPGSTPSSLALSPDQTRLFVANANINAVAVFDVSTPGKSRSLGLIPTGWYPTSVRVTLDGKRLLVANGKGVTSRANRYGPQPGREAPEVAREYIGGLFQGTVSVIDLPSRERFEERLREFTERCRRGRPPSAGGAGAPPARSADNPIPARVGGKSPIRYCIYIIKENRTYDQVLGDLPQGNGDATLCLFPENVTPNHHKLARDFVQFDNFYVDSEVSADGHEWSMGAYATDFVEKLWPLSYGHNDREKYSYPAEGRFRIASPAEGYLWDRARQAGVSYRSYGEFVDNGETPRDARSTRVASLQGHFDPGFQSFDVDYSDLARADRFISELKRFEREGEMPQLQIVRLPNDHTAGATLGKLTPTAYVAQNDAALGRVVEAVSRSRFWPQTAIFVIEDDSQDGPDHVDAHRTVAFAVSPYTRRGGVDSTLYSTTSMLRTMELILGLRPMSQFDAAATPMFQAFHGQPDPRPYLAEAARVYVEKRNDAQAWGGALSLQMDFTREDAADDQLLNQIIWRSVKGDELPMPPPARAAFVLGGRDDD